MTDEPEKNEALPGGKRGSSTGSSMVHGISLFCGACLAFGFLGAWVNREHLALGDAALGAGTTSVFEQRDDLPVHMGNLEPLTRVAGHLRQSGTSRSLLWLGNSQLHAINQYQPGQHNAPAILHDTLARDGRFLATISLPNANFQEHLACVLATAASGCKPDVIILPAVFDDTREDGLRTEISQWWARHRVSLEEYRAMPGVVQLENDLGSSGSAETTPEKAVPRSLMDRSEEGLDAWLSKSSTVWSARGRLRGEVFLKLYTLRNSVFGITAQSTRRRIDSRYQKNLDAFDGILRASHALGAEVLVYVAPLRGDVPPPYDASEYAQFKSTIEAKCRNAPHARFVNIESLVPAEMWGRKESTELGGELEIDFMHFQASGHEILAQRLASEIAGCVRQ